MAILHVISKINNLHVDMNINTEAENLLPYVIENAKELSEWCQW